METYRWYVRSNRERLGKTIRTLQGRGEGIQDIPICDTPVQVEAASWSFPVKILNFACLTYITTKNFENIFLRMCF